MKPKEPSLRQVRLLLIRALDMLPAHGPEWHPTYQTARRVRERLGQARRSVVRIREVPSRDV